MSLFVAYLLALSLVGSFASLCDFHDPLHCTCLDNDSRIYCLIHNKTQRVSLSGDGLPSTAETLFIEGDGKLDLVVDQSPLKLKHLTIVNFNSVSIAADLSSVDCVHLLLNANTNIDDFPRLNSITDADIFPGLLGDDVDVKAAYLAFFYKNCQLKNDIADLENVVKHLTCKKN